MGNSYNKGAVNLAFAEYPKKPGHIPRPGEFP